MILVVGGSGLVGQALQREVLKNGTHDDYVFTYNTHDNIDQRLDKMHMDLMNLTIKDAARLRGYNRAIYVAGGHLFNFVQFATIFRGSLVLLSSMAAETATGYGMKKKMGEEYAKNCLCNGMITKLWIIRLSYTYGPGEREDRLIPRLAREVATGRGFELIGLGARIDPLPVETVAKELISVQCGEEKLKESTLTSSLPLTVEEMIAILKDRNMRPGWKNMQEYYNELVRKYQELS